MNQEITDIWNNFHQELKAFIQKRTQNRTATDDILQEVFVKIITKIDTVNQTENLRQYIYAMVRNGIVDHYRQQKLVLSEVPIPDMGISNEASDNLTEIIANRCIRPFIEKLGPKYQEALTLAELENVPQTELATQLGISYSGAKSRVQRGREKLKAQLLQCCHFESDKYGNLIEMRKRCCSNN